MTHQLIVDLREGMEIQQYFVVRQVEERLTRSGEPYFDLVLADRSGSLKAKLWSNVLQDFPGPFRAGDYVGAVGQVKSYHGELQLTVQRTRTIEQIKQLKKELKDFDVSLLHASTAYDREQMWRELLALVEDELIPPLKDLVVNLLHQHAEAWQTGPAARRNHHAYLGGLLEHTWFVVRLAYQTAKMYPDINRQLVVAGAVLHDLGKLKELAQPYAPEYTIPGQLLGHIVLGWEMIRQEATKIHFPDQNLLLQLEHIIITHHGYQEFGSPVPPKTREAMLVYYADDLDAKLKMMEQHLQADNSEREFTPYHRLLQRELYKITEEHEPEAPVEESKDN
jgi:3'-5' exoribonuclease